MKTIPLTQGKVAFVDDEDHAYVSQFTWHASFCKGQWKARTTIGKRTQGGRKTLYMHVLIMQPPTGLVVDHWNHDGLDNQRRNLRVTTQRMNTVNRKPRGASGFHGVCLTTRGKWRVQVGRNGSLFMTECRDILEAARLYDTHALLHYGEFAHLNFPDERSA